MREASQASPHLCFLGCACVPVSALIRECQWRRGWGQPVCDGCWVWLLHDRNDGGASCYVCMAVLYPGRRIYPAFAPARFLGGCARKHAFGMLGHHLGWCCVMPLAVQGKGVAKVSCLSVWRTRESSKSSLSSDIFFGAFTEWLFVMLACGDWDRTQSLTCTLPGRAPRIRGCR